MRECYIPQKVMDLFHVKHYCAPTEAETQQKIERIISSMHSEILLANKEFERRLVRKLELLLRSEL